MACGCNKNQASKAQPKSASKRKVVTSMLAKKAFDNSDKTDRSDKEMIVTDVNGKKYTYYV